MTTPPTFTTPPTAPSRSDASATFVTRANAFIAWFATLYAELVALVSWLTTTVAAALSYKTDALAAKTAAEAAADAAIGITTLLATSTATLTMALGSTGSFAFAETGRTLAVADQVTFIRRSNKSVRMRGAISAIDTTARTMTVTISALSSTASGSAADWLILLSALEATAPDDVAGLALSFAAAL